MKNELRKEKIRKSILTVVKFKRNDIDKRELKRYMDEQGFTLNEYIYVLDSATEIAEKVEQKVSRI